MEREKPPAFAGGALPPHPSRHVAFPPPPLKREPPELSRMADHPTRSAGHRRAHSEILTLPDNIDADLSPVEPPSFSDEDPLSVYLDMDKLASAAAAVQDAERPRYRHGHSQSMDGSASASMLGSGGGGGTSTSLAEEKKAMSAAELADLALVDPKRAKRIWANRQSAARSKERKMRYIAELERKVQTLQMEATTLSAQLTMLHRDTNGLTSENNELKLRLQSVEQQVNLQDALNDALREEVQRLKVATGQVNLSIGGPSAMTLGSSSLGGKQQFYHHNQAVQSLMAAHQLQQLQIHPQHQQQLHPNHYQQQQQLPSDFRFKGVTASQMSTSDNTFIPKE